MRFLKVISKENPFIPPFFAAILVGICAFSTGACNGGGSSGTGVEDAVLAPESECFSDNQTSSACSLDSYCQFESGTCGEHGEAGSCVARPQNCLELFQPVCGCDGKTYGNDCEAQGAGVSVRTVGECR